MIYYAPDIPLTDIKLLPDAPKPKGNPGRKARPYYKAVVCAFDIESTALKKIQQSFMYIWQLQIGMDITIIGRTWDQFLDVESRIREALGVVKLVTYVHNLSYEFQFLSGIWKFKPEDVFCTEPRSILHADMGCFEFRCSYRLSNMSLNMFTYQMRVAHRKLSGDKFDYDKVRYPWTKLTEYEINYATYDVIGLVEAVTQLLTNEGDTLYSVPQTSTGYVRRDEKKSMKSYNWDTMRRQIPDYELHKKLRRSFRGGNTHADRHFVGQILHDVQSWDMASAYPSAMVNKEFPTGRWYELPPERCTLEVLDDLINRRHKAVLLQAAFVNIRLKDPRWPVPYISYDKCDNVTLYTQDDIRRYNRSGKPGRRLWVSMDNGRILAAQYADMIINDIDLQIISQEYEWDDIRIQYVAFSTYGKLPNQIREVVLDYYHRKTTLKGVKGSEYLYDASKRKLNAIYGGTVMDPIQIHYLFDEAAQNPDGVPYVPDQSKTEEQLYQEATRWPYQSYAWGCWVTSWCRLRLEAGIKTVYDQGEKELQQIGRIKTHFVYCDTDSIKFVGAADIGALNEPYMDESIKNGASAQDPKGKIHYLGVYEYEGTYPEFLTWGAKKYIYREVDGSEILNGIDLDPDGRIENGNTPMRCTVLGTGDTWHITIAGVNKKDGAREIERKGGIHALLPDEFGRPKFVFRDSGGVEAIYNDDPEVKSYRVGKHVIPITRNVYLQKHAYTLDITDDFSWIVEHPDAWRDLVDASVEV